MSSNYVYDELSLLGLSASDRALSNHEFSNAALVTYEAYNRDPSLFPHCGLLGSVMRQTTNDGVSRVPEDPRLYLNTSTPWSAVVCGVQGSGKSHTVSCLLEACLIADRRIGTQTEPLAGLAFHYDEENGGRPCEVAYLSAPADSSLTLGPYVRNVTVLVSPGNFQAMREVYSTLPNVEVQPLYFKEANLNASRLLAMMGCDNIDTLPLYMKKALSIVRELGATNFTYSGFKAKLKEAGSNFNDVQRAGVETRTGLLDSYLDDYAPDVTMFFGKGDLVIVDLSDPFLAAVDAALLFDMVLGLFVDWGTSAGKIIVLDEAHKYLTNSAAGRLARTLASLIRQQRHLGIRLVIATQEPTAVPVTLIELSSFVICHKFSSPREGVLEGTWENEVVQLRTGQALVFCSGALCLKITDWETAGMATLGMGCLLIRTRLRVTMDGGRSIIAGRALPAPRPGKAQASALVALPDCDSAGIPIPLNLPAPNPRTLLPNLAPATPVKLQRNEVESWFMSSPPSEQGGASPRLPTQSTEQQNTSPALEANLASASWSSIAKRDAPVAPTSPTLVKFSATPKLLNPVVRIPAIFAALVRALRTHPQERPMRSAIHDMLMAEQSDYLARAGFTRWAEYAQAAYAAGVVEMGVVGGGAWIALKKGSTANHAKPTTMMSIASRTAVTLASLYQPSSGEGNRFGLLLNALNSHGDSYVLQNALAAELKMADPDYLAKAGFEKWGLYVDAAAVAGLVAIGGHKGGMAWIHNISTDSKTSVQLNAPHVIDPHFSLLVKVLEEHPDDIPMRSRVADQLIAMRPGYFSAGLSGFFNWKEYAAAAEQSGVIVLGGGDNGYPWVALPSRLQGAARTTTPSPEPTTSTENASWNVTVSAAAKKYFALLVGIIREQRSIRPVQSVVAQQMRTKYPAFQNHFSSWAQLVTAATSAGRMKTGGAGGKEWISCA